MSGTLDAFRLHLVATESPRTVLAYLRDAERFEVFRNGRSAGIDTLEAWAGSMNQDSLNPQTVARRLAGAKRWLAFRARHGDADAMATLTVLANGYALLKGPREADRKRVEPVAPGQYMAAKDRAPAWGAALMHTLWWTGARISEVIGDPLASVAIPPLTVSDGAALAERRWTEVLAKGGRRRAICVPSSARQLLADWVQGKPPEAPLFPSPQDPSRPVTAAAARQMLKRTGVGHPHAFRHAYKARLRRAGVAEEVIRALMGHGPRYVTDRYGVVSLEEMLAAAERMAGAS